MNINGMFVYQIEATKTDMSNCSTTVTYWVVAKNSVDAETYVRSKLPPLSVGGTALTVKRYPLDAFVESTSIDVHQL